MPWFLIRRGVELLLGLALLEAFSSCRDISGTLVVLERMDHLQQVGALTAVVVLGAAIVEMPLRAWAAMRETILRWTAAVIEAVKRFAGPDDKA
jgi:hypothetical protein